MLCNTFSTYLVDNNQFSIYPLFFHILLSRILQQHVKDHMDWHNYWKHQVHQVLPLYRILQYKRFSLKPYFLLNLYIITEFAFTTENTEIFRTFWCDFLFTSKHFATKWFSLFRCFRNNTFLVINIIVILKYRHSY